MKGSPSCPCVHFAVRSLLYCKLIDERILQNCVVVRAAAAQGSHRQRFSPRSQVKVSCQPQPRFADTLCQLPRFAGYSLSWLGQRYRGHTRLIHERDKLKQILNSYKTSLSGTEAEIIYTCAVSAAICNL